MDHHTAAELFSSFVDGEISDAAKDDLSRHLAIWRNFGGRSAGSEV
jgi:hypothetical protein